MADVPDNICPAILKAASAVIAPSLCRLFNLSLQQGVVPRFFKSANITPIPKPNRDANIVENYRAISLTPVLSKLLESIVRQQLLDYCNEDNLFHDAQYGFRKGRSCEDVILVCTEKWRRARDQGKTVAVAFLDLSKAFDNVSHQRLLSKLKSHRISGTVLLWFADYLSERSQRVTINGSSSNCAPVQKGVPQGSVLGPTLFNVYVSHIPGVVHDTSAEVPSYADDLTIFAIDESPGRAISNVSNALGVISTELENDGLTLNMIKSCSMVLTKDDSGVQPITCRGQVLRAVPHARLLGPEVDSQLTWEHQTRLMSAKISRKIGVLRRARRHLSPQAKRLFLLSVILPDFDYACTSIACGLSAAARNRLSALERRAVRVACDAGYTDDCSPMYDHLKITPLEERWCTKFALTAYQCTHHLRAPSVCNLLSPASGSTRHANTCGVIPPRCRTKTGVNSFANRASLLWNALPSSVRLLNFPHFKSFVLARNAMKPYMPLLFDCVSDI